MKKVIPLIVFLTWTFNYVQGQITSYKIEKLEPTERIVLPYDSLTNITRENLPSLVGQKVQILPQKKRSSLGLDTGPTIYNNRPKGFNNNEYVVNPDTRFTIYKSKYGAFDNEVFDIIGVDSINSGIDFSPDSKDFYLIISNEKYNTPHYLDLGRVDDKYIKTLSTSDFIIIGYFEKLKSSVRGKKIVNKYPNNRYLTDNIVYNLSDGKPLSEIPENNIWEIIDLSFIDTDNYKGLSYILDSDSIKNVFTRASMSYFTPYEEFIEQQAKTKAWETEMIKKYGKQNGNLIIQGKVKIGFTKEMCREAWGSPEDINTSSGPWGTHEQWVYGLGSYLYFENGKLTSIDN